MKKMLSATLFLHLALGLVAFTSAPAHAQEEYQCPAFVEHHFHEDIHLSFCNSELYKTEVAEYGLMCYYHGYVCNSEYLHDWAEYAGSLQGPSPRETINP